MNGTNSQPSDSEQRTAAGAESSGRSVDSVLYNSVVYQMALVIWRWTKHSSVWRISEILRRWVRESTIHRRLFDSSSTTVRLDLRESLLFGKIVARLPGTYPSLDAAWDESRLRRVTRVLAGIDSSTRSTILAGVRWLFVGLEPERNRDR